LIEINGFWSFASSQVSIAADCELRLAAVRAGRENGALEGHHQK
jgi:hypothetical protein